MSLREEIAILYVRKRKNQIGTELADEIINKILGAAVEAIHEEYPEYHEDAYICIQAINKLKGAQSDEHS